MINSLTARIFTIFWFTLALVLMLVLMVAKFDLRQITPLLESEYRQGLMLEQHIEAELAGDQINNLMWWRRLSNTIQKWAPPGQHLIMVTSEGLVIDAIHNEMQLIHNFIEQSDKSDYPKKKKYGRIEMLGPFSIRNGKKHYQLYLVRPANSPKSDFINLLFDRPFLLLVTTMLISTPMLLWLTWSLAKPAKKLKMAADDVANGNLHQHPELMSGPQEFLAVGNSFNQMISSLEGMVNAQQRMISNIFHELRTPLTRLQLATALLRRRHGESKELERIETETLHLDNMINDLLVLSHSQHKNKNFRQNIKVTNLWNDILDNATFEAEQMNKKLNVTAPPGAWTIYCNPPALGSALENIVRNALRYSYNHIEVSFKEENQGILITVDDDGLGVAKEDRKKIFLPFYRTNKSRDRQSGRTGLGLAIVETTVFHHKGWVKASDSPLGGLQLRVWLPLHGS